VFFTVSFVDIKQLVCNVYTGESSVFVKSEVDSNDITECSHDDQPMTGMLTYNHSLFISAVCILFLMFCFPCEYTCLPYYL